MTAIVVGIGSPHGDDRLGWMAIDRLRTLLPAGIEARAVRGGIELLECLAGQDMGIIIDAMAPIGRPGTIRTFDWPCLDLASHTPSCTHDLGLVEALQLAGAMDQLPIHLVIHTIEARQTSPGADPSPELVSHLDDFVQVILEMLRDKQS
jgi:hydrogenase maturation protease